MKNMIKMSLVAAVAVAGLSSTVAAKPLEEAIKNVDITGSVLYRYNDYNNDVTKKSGTTNYYKIASTIKSKVNDTVTAAVRVVATNDATGGLTGLDTSSAKDGNVNVAVSQANFVIKTDAATVIAGKQGLATPWTVAIDADGNEQTGTGILTLVPAGPVTIAAAYFNQTNLGTSTTNADNAAAVTNAATSYAYDVAVAADATANAKSGAASIATIGAMAKVGPVALDAWYIDQADILDSYTIGAKATIEGITADVRYTSLDLDTSSADNSLLVAKLSGKIADVSVWGQYGMTNKEGGTTALEGSAKTTVEGWNVALNGKRDADYYGFGAGMDVMSGLNVALNLRAVDYLATAGSNVETEEMSIYTQVTHKMGKNLVTYVRFGTYDKETAGVEANDDLRGRLQVEYKF